MTRSGLLVATAALGLALAAGSGAATASNQAADTSGAPSPAATPGASTGSPAADPSPSDSPSPSPANQAPVAHDDSATVQAGQSVTVDVLANDTDDGQGRPAGAAPHLEVTAVDSPQASYTAQDVTFHAASGDSGTHVVQYTVSDGQLTDVGRLTVDVRQALARGVTIRLASGPVALRSYSIHGTVQPAVPAAATVVVQRRLGDRWVTWGADRPDAQGSYAVPFRTNRPIRYVFRAVAKWPDGKVTRSSSISRTVRALLDPQVSGPLTRDQVPYSWRSGCPVPPSGLRKVTLNRFDYRHRVARGSLVVRASTATSIVRVFRAGFGARFPIKSMNPTDRYYRGGDRTPTQSDLASMRAGNTAAFNCRPVTGNPYRMSQHSYGNAIDINTIQNPYVTGSRVYPSFAREYLDRSPYRKGMILRGGAIATEMRQVGWPWGARWAHPDYQHFSSTGG